MSKVLQNLGVRYPVEFSYNDVGSYPKFPWIRPSSFIKALSETGDLSRLLGGHQKLCDAEPLIVEFWSRHRKTQPHHGIYKKFNNQQLKQCIPIYIHGDEGVTYKRSGVLILSLQTPWGKGSGNATAVNDVPPSDLENIGIPLNFLQTTLQTRLLALLAPKDIGHVAP